MNDNILTTPTIMFDVNTEDIKLHLCISNNMLDGSKASNIALKMSEIVAEVISQSETIREKSNISEFIKPNNTSSEKERPMFRDRLPNAIDVSELTFQNAITEDKLARCPGCGQCTSLIVDFRNSVNGGLALLGRKISDSSFKVIEVVTNKDKEEYDNIIEGWKRKSNMSFEDYYKEICSLLDAKKDEEDIDIVVDNETTLICPDCNSTYLFKDWKAAYDMPLNFFEYTNPCPICGGEVTTVKKRKGYINSCEKCGYESSPWEF